MSDSIKVNGREVQVSGSKEPNLLEFLRNELGLNGPKFGCGLGQCGACTVLVDGHPVRSCLLSVESTLDRAVTTLEGLGTPETPSRVQQAFIDQQAMQCGYCVNGMIMTATALLAKTPTPSRREITTALDGNLCRCGSHNRIIRAVLRASGQDETQ